MSQVEVDCSVKLCVFIPTVKWYLSLGNNYNFGLALQCFKYLWVLFVVSDIVFIDCRCILFSLLRIREFTRAKWDRLTCSIASYLWAHLKNAGLVKSAAELGSISLIESQSASGYFGCEAARCLLPRNICVFQAA